MRRLKTEKYDGVTIRFERDNGVTRAFARDLGKDWILIGHGDTKIIARKKAHRYIDKQKAKVKMTNQEFLEGDFDGDGVKNKEDCRPFDKDRHFDYQTAVSMNRGRERPSMYRPQAGKTIYVKKPIFKAFQIIEYGKDLGLTPREIHQELREKGYSGDQMRQATQAYNEHRLGANIKYI